MEENHKTLTLIELLDEFQPYNVVDRLQDTQLSEIDIKNEFLPRIQGSLVSLAIGDALGACVEFYPNAYMRVHPVFDMKGGGTWGLKAGQWTDDTSMALFLAASLIIKGDFESYDQLVRYKRWFREVYMSSTGQCFDIRTSTEFAIKEFEKGQQQSVRILQQKFNITTFKHSLDRTIEDNLSALNFDIQCGAANAAGNDPLMRLASIALFYFRSASDAIKNAGDSARLTHGDRRAIDACQYYSALNLGGDTDTTAAIYGQLVGAVYGIEGIPKRWHDQLFQIDFILTLVKGLYIKGKHFNPQKQKSNVVVNL